MVEQKPGGEQLDPEALRITTDDGYPAVEFPSGQKLRLRVHVTEWTHDRPRNGESVDMEVEVDADDFAWWTIYPERTDVMAGDKRDNFPTMSIEPEFIDPEEE